MQDKLAQLEKKYGVDWREFRIGDIFEKLTSRFLGQGDKFKAVSRKRTEEFCIPIVYAKSGDNGIMYWAKEGDFETHGNVISIIYNGAIAAGLVYAQEKPTGTLAESYLIKSKIGNPSFKANLYISQALMKVLYPKYSREYLATWGKVQKDFVKLPTQNGEIAYEFMNKFVETLEAERLAMLEAYLKATGLNNVALSAEERSSLDKLVAGSVEWREFSLKELFEIYTGRDFIMMTSQKGKIPVISRSSANNGFGIFSDEVQGQKLFNHKETITATLIGKIWSTVHNQDFYLGTRVKGLVIRDKRTSFEMLQFISASLNKVGKSYITYQNKPAEFEGLSIKLPVKNDGELDFEFMTILIKAMQKIVIKGVVKWADKRIEATKGVIENG